MAGFFDFIQHSGIDPVKSSIQRPIQAGGDLLKGKPGKAYTDLRHIVSDNEKAQSKGMGDYGLRGWVGKHPLESAGALVATIYGGAAAAGAYGAGASGTAAAGSGAAGSSAGAGAFGGGALGGSTVPATPGMVAASNGGGAAIGTGANATSAAYAGGGSSSFGSSLMSNPQAMSMAQNMLGGSNGQGAQPNPNGGTSSLGGVGWQAYTQPGAGTQNFNVSNKDTAVSGSEAIGQKSATIGDVQQAPATISAAVGEKVPEKKGILQRMNEASSDQWDNFTGSGKYDSSNKDNLDAQGNLKTKGALGFQDKMQAGFGLAAAIMNGFDRR